MNADQSARPRNWLTAATEIVTLVEKGLSGLFSGGSGEFDRTESP